MSEISEMESNTNFDLLARRIDDQSILVFMMPVRTRRDMDAKDNFIATVGGLEGRLVATGGTFDEAREAALDLFVDLIDDAIESSKEPIPQVVAECLHGTGMVFLPVARPLSEAEEVFSAISKAIAKQIHDSDRTDESEEWRLAAV